MIARAKKSPRNSSVSACREKFLSILPAIREQARFAFQNEKSEHRQELTAEVIANCWAAFVRLVERGLLEVVYPTPLAQYAIKQVRDGRRVGAKLNVPDMATDSRIRIVSMATPKCPKPDCDNTCFQMEHLSPLSSNFTFEAVVCSKCDCIVGIVDSTNVPKLIRWGGGMFFWHVFTWVYTPTRTSAVRQFVVLSGGGPVCVARNAWNCVSGP